MTLLFSSYPKYSSSSLKFLNYYFLIDSPKILILLISLDLYIKINFIIILT